MNNLEEFERRMKLKEERLNEGDGEFHYLDNSDLEILNLMMQIKKLENEDKEKNMI